MQFTDDRTPEEKKTHPCIIIATDRFMSGWGKADGGPSYAGWACRVEDACAVEQWVRSRKEMIRVREVGSDYRPPAGEGHCHIYVVRDGHPLSLSVMIAHNVKP